MHRAPETEEGWRMTVRKVVGEGLEGADSPSMCNMIGQQKTKVCCHPVVSTQNQKGLSWQLLSNFLPPVVITPSARQSEIEPFKTKHNFFPSLK